MTVSVLYCSNAYPPNFIGGAELVAHYHAQRLQRLGLRVAVFAADAFGPPRHQVTDTVYEGLPVYRIGVTSEDFSFAGVNFVNPPIESRFDDVLKAFRPDIVHFHNMIGLSIRLIRISRRFGAACVLTAHDHWAYCFRNLMLPQGGICDDSRDCSGCQATLDNGRGGVIPIRLRNDFLISELALLDWLLFPSHYLAEWYLRAGADPRRVRVLSNGYDALRFARIRRVPDPGALRLAFIGRLGEHKGARTLIEALSLLSPQAPVSLVIAGEGELREPLEEEVRKRHLTGKVRFLGKIEHTKIEAVFEQTDVLVLPSVWPENQPVVITEAMSAGIPVIGSRIGGIPELVRDGQTGYVFEMGNARDLASKIQRLLDSPEDRARFGANARAIAEKQSYENQALELSRLYAGLLQPEAARQS